MLLFSILRSGEGNGHLDRNQNFFFSLQKRVIRGNFSETKSTFQISNFNQSHTMHKIKIPTIHLHSFDWKHKYFVVNQETNVWTCYQIKSSTNSNHLNNVCDWLTVKEGKHSTRHHSKDSMPNVKQNKDTKRISEFIYSNIQAPNNRYIHSIFTMIMMEWVLNIVYNKKNIWETVKMNGPADNAANEWKKNLMKSMVNEKKE